METIFVVSHLNNFKISTRSNLHQIIRVGESANMLSECEEYKDNTLDNISQKNKFYCELTALYWIWKNINCDVIGLEHYRRYFIGTEPLVVNPNGKPELIYAISKDEINDILAPSNDTMILPKPWIMKKTTVKDQFSSFHGRANYLLMEKCLVETYPNLREAFLDIMNSNRIYTCNMFICKTNLIHKYCEWLFPLLLKIENAMDLSLPANNRMIGYMSERLFNVWLLIHHPHIVEKDTIVFVGKENGLIKRMKRRIQARKMGY